MEHLAQVLVSLSLYCSRWSYIGLQWDQHKIETTHLRTIEDQLHCSLYLIPNGVNKHISRVSQMTQVDFNLITLANLNYFNARA